MCDIRKQLLLHPLANLSEISGCLPQFQLVSMTWSFNVTLHVIMMKCKQNPCQYTKQLINHAGSFILSVIRLNKKYIGFPSQFNINSIQIDFQIIQFRANLYAHLKVYFNLQIRRFNFNNCSNDLVHQSFNLIKQALNRQKGSINFIKSARN